LTHEDHEIFESLPRAGKRLAPRLLAEIGDDRLPQHPDLLFLASKRKGGLLHGQGNDVLEMVGLGITAARLPPPTARRETRSLSASPACVSPREVRRASMLWPKASSRCLYENRFIERSPFGVDRQE
jgi:hypothetical protein